MFRSLCILVLLCICLAPWGCRASEDSTLVHYMDFQGPVDDHSSYFIDMLYLAMDKSRDKYGDFTLTPLVIPMRQDRQFMALADGTIDVLWTVTSIEREHKALAIKIPLLKGLIGHRVLVIAKARAADFEAINDKSGLAKYLGLQGHDWPDVEIMEHAGLKVEKVVWHDKVYKLVSDGIVDYFPRSILEVETELDRAGVADLLVEPRLLLLYPSALYFFVNKHNTTLAERLEWGLNQAIEDGSFNRLFMQQPSHASAINALAQKEYRVIKLANPLLPVNTPLRNQKLWATEFEN